jgi:spermidine/putrescine transport system permease protein
MATITTDRPSSGPSTAGPLVTRRPLGARVSSWMRNHIIQILALLALIYTFLPIIIVVLFSFNDPQGRYNYSWNQFSVQAWANPCDDPSMCTAVKLSLQIGIIATILSTVIGTMMAFAMGRHRYRGRALTNILIFLPMATPEIVMGSSLLALFINTVGPQILGTVTIIIAHVMFSISFVVVTVKARIAGLDPKLEQAAMDLYADERSTFWKVTFPLVLPGIVAAALLAFSLSFDDYIITNFNASSTSITFPMWVWGAAQRGLPPQANVVGSAMFLVALTVVLVPELIRARRRKVA